MASRTSTASGTSSFSTDPTNATNTTQVDTPSNVVPQSQPNREDYAWSAQWTAVVNRMRAPILRGIQVMTRASAQNPYRTIALIVILSVGTFVTGLFTNFSVDVDENVLWTPMGSHPIRHMQWIEDPATGYPASPRFVNLIFHAHGATDRVLSRASVAQIFEAVDAIRFSMPEYAKVCALDSQNKNSECPIYGVTKFWNQSSSLFQSRVASDADAIAQMSVQFFPDDGTPLSEHDIWGNPVRQQQQAYSNSTSSFLELLMTAQNYRITIILPNPYTEKDLAIVQDFETKVIDLVLDWQETWNYDKGFPNNSSSRPLNIEVFAERSFADEFERAIVNDIPLVPIVFVIMGIFTSAIFFKRDKVHSRSLFGFTAVISILLSIMAGYGILFISAVPFTSMTQILPFVFFGVGLDDAFIITGTYFRLNTLIDPVERVRITMDEIGISIFLTTLTSAVAMALGCTSSIPAVYWLCLYAVPTTFLILIWQLTFFIACLILDERRVEANHRDCFRCLQRGNPAVSQLNPNKSSQSNLNTTDEGGVYHENRVDKFMAWYAETLLLPWVKGLVLLSFAAIAAACAVSTSHLKQSFSFTDVLPGDSYITNFFDAWVDYSARSSINPSVYFRDVDQSNPEVQNQMEEFVNELVTIDAIVEQPQFFWLRDFRSFVFNSNVSSSNSMAMSEWPFSLQIAAFLTEPIYQELYGDHIVRNSTTGEITTSRCVIYMDNVDQENIKDVVKALNDQNAISEKQPVNEGTDDYSFFTYDGNYNIWQFYAQSAREVASNTITSIAAMTGIALLFMPHWSAAFFVFPLTAVLYIDLMGVMHWAGVSINPVSYVALVMSIGLLVDFVIHVLLRFYEAKGNRHEKAVDVLKTVGSSILIGAITTFLGTLPLAFSTSDIFYTVFIAFLALVVLGATHGLILLPVVLSMIGPEVEIPVVSVTKTLDRQVSPQEKYIHGDDGDDFSSVHA